MIKNRNDIKFVGGNMNRKCVLMDGVCQKMGSLSLSCHVGSVSSHHHKKKSKYRTARYCERTRAHLLIFWFNYFSIVIVNLLFIS